MAPDSGCAGNAVHPHAGGENAYRWRCDGPQNRFTPTRVGKTAIGRDRNVRLSGSPPRGWGKLTRSGLGIGFTRFTPTRVGKTSVPLWWYGMFSVHPHAGGENLRRNSVRPTACGSPPRGWGKRTTSPSSGVQRVGSPPRGWGKRALVRLRALSFSVHPHAGGENITARRLVWPYNGSPPRGWGKRAPRCRIWCCNFGSPPRGWGKHTAKELVLEHIRFTPTRVGKTASCPATRPTCAVHPHAGGENVHASIAPMSSLGSPPRGWGKRKAFTLSTGTLYGSPPRGWGKRGLKKAGSSHSTVHPHAGGENSVKVPLRLH